MQCNCQEIVIIRKLILATFVAASLGGIVTPANAALILREAPPPLREEVMPPTRRGHVWSAGHCEWRQSQHQWVAGRWIRERRGYHYNQPTWVERYGGWQMERAQWRRGDRDGDGVPNRQDRAPNNPNRN